MKHNDLPAALYWKHGPIFDCLDGQVRKWPDGFTPLTNAEQAQLVADYKADQAKPKPPTPLQSKIDVALADSAVPASVKAVLTELRTEFS